MDVFYLHNKQILTMILTLHTKCFVLKGFVFYRQIIYLNRMQNNKLKIRNVCILNKYNL